MRKLNKKFKRFGEDLLDNSRVGITMKGHDINHNVKMIFEYKNIILINHKFIP